MKLELYANLIGHYRSFVLERPVSGVQFPLKCVCSLMLGVAFNVFKWINILENSTVYPQAVAKFWQQHFTLRHMSSKYNCLVTKKLYVHFRSSQLFSPNNFVKGSNNSPEKLKWQPGLYKWYASGVIKNPYTRLLLARAAPTVH